MGSVWVCEAPVRAGWHAGTYYRFSLRTGTPPSFRPRSRIENGFGPFGRGGSAWTEFFLLAGEYAYKDVQLYALERIVEHFVQLRLSRGSAVPPEGGGHASTSSTLSR